MLVIERFVNQLMSSNCYVLTDKKSRHCLCIDPASEKSEREIAYIMTNDLKLDYIFLTHEHTDHTWGVNALVKQFPFVNVVCSNLCRVNLSKEFRHLFSFYYNNPDYHYTVCKVDYTTEELDGKLFWYDHKICFHNTPGHSKGSICVAIDDILFGGDTLMPFKPFIKKRNGGSMEELRDSFKMISEMYNMQTIVYPGHGEKCKLEDVLFYLQ